MIFRRLLLIPLLLLVGIVVGAACGGDDEPKGPIVLIEQDWDGNLVTTHVAKLILSEHMGYTVETKVLCLKLANIWPSWTCSRSRKR